MAIEPSFVVHENRRDYTALACARLSFARLKQGGAVERIAADWH